MKCQGSEEMTKVTFIQDDFQKKTIEKVLAINIKECHDVAPAIFIFLSISQKTGIQRECNCTLEKQKIIQQSRRSVSVTPTLRLPLQIHASETEV